MNTYTTHAPSDLILRLAGGQRDGETISVSTSKCLLGLSSDSSTSGHCAIYRGPAGVAVQSHGDDVLVNGAATSVHWLQTGDQIQLPNSQTVEVLQLGEVAQPAAEQFESNEGDALAESFETPTCETPTCEADPQPTAAEVETDSPDCFDLAPQNFAASDDHACSDDTLGPDDAADAFVSQEPIEASESTLASTEVDQRFQVLESCIEEMRNENSQVGHRFDRLENQLGDLVEKMGLLVDTAVNAQPVAEVNDVPDAPVEVVEAVAEVAEESEDTTEGALPVAGIRQEEDTNDDLQRVFELLNQDAEPVAPIAMETPLAPETAEVSDAVGFTPDAAVAEQPAVETPPEHTHEDLASVFSALSADLPESTDAVEPAAEGFFEVEQVQEVSGASLDSSIQSDIEPIDESEASEQVATGQGLPWLEPMQQEEIQSEETPQPATEAPLAPEASFEGVATTEEPSSEPSNRPAVPTASVADIFARLQQGGTGEEAVATNSSASDAPVVDATYDDLQASMAAAFEQDFAPVGAPDVSTPVEPTAVERPVADDSPVVSAIATPQLQEVGSDAIVQQEITPEPAPAEARPVAERSKQDSVGDYMSMLLSRMNVGEDEEAPVEAELPVPVPVPAEPEEPVMVEQAIPAEPETETPEPVEEEFQVERKTAPIVSIEKMRELANSSSRSAIEHSVKSLKQERSRSLIIQSAALAGLALAGVFGYLGSYFISGVFLAVFVLTFGYVCYDTFKPANVGSAKKSQPNKSKPAPTTAEPTQE